MRVKGMEHGDGVCEPGAGRLPDGQRRRDRAGDGRLRRPRAVRGVSPPLRPLDPQPGARPVESRRQPVLDLGVEVVGGRGAGKRQQVEPDGAGPLWTVRTASGRGQPGVHRAGDTAVGRVVKSRHPNLHRAVDRILAMGLVLGQQLLVLGAERRHHPLDVGAGAQHGVAVGGHLHRSRPQVAQQVHARPPQVSGAGGHQPGLDDAQLSRGELGRFRRVVLDVTEQPDELVRGVVGERVVVRGHRDPATPGPTRCQAPDLQPGLIGEREPDQLDPTRRLDIGRVGATAAARGSDQLEAGTEPGCGSASAAWARSAASPG